MKAFGIYGFWFNLGIMKTSNETPYCSGSGTHSATQINEGL